MDSKCVISLCILALLSLINGQSHDLSLGTVGVNDALLTQINHWKIGIPFTVRTSDIDYPTAGIIQPQNITAIFAKDQYTNGQGGYASISSGGLGQRYVRIHLKSQRGNAMNFTISIYGR